MNYLLLFIIIAFSINAKPNYILNLKESLCIGIYEED